MRYYELTINTKEADFLLERIVSKLPNPAVWQKKGPNFLSLGFYSQPEDILELEKKLKAESLRYLILVKELPKRTSEITKKSKKTISRPKQKVELKDIEKKLEEVLHEFK